MRQDTDPIETQVNAMLGRWADDFDAVPGPSPAAVERTRSAVRHEINERWLAAHPTPVPSHAALDEAREAVRHELARARNRPTRWFSPQVRAGLAAAAVIAICVGLIRQIGAGGTRTPAAGPETPLAAAEHVELFVEAAHETLGADPFAESVLSELHSIDERLAGSSGDVTSENVLDELDSAIRDVLDDNGPGNNTTGRVPRSPEVLG